MVKQSNKNSGARDIKDTDLHVYLDRKPEPESFSAILEIYGFNFVKEHEPTKTDPMTRVYDWNTPGLSGAGFRLLHFDDLFSDDLNYGKYGSFVILSAHQDSSVIDFNMVDITAIFLLTRYGGRLHNPHRIEKISTSYFLSGVPFAGFTAKGT